MGAPHKNAQARQQAPSSRDASPIAGKASRWRAWLAVIGSLAAIGGAIFVSLGYLPSAAPANLAGAPAVRTAPAVDTLPAAAPAARSEPRPTKPELAGVGLPASVPRPTPEPPAIEPQRPSHEAAAATNAAREETTEIGIAYGTEKKAWLEQAQREFAATLAGGNIRIKLIPMGSLESAHSILDGNQQIHVWSPASSLYRELFLREWRSQRRGNPIRRSEALAYTPMALVMWQNRYEAYVKRCPEVSLRTISFALRERTGWESIAGESNWGLFKFGFTDPAQSNSGLMALVVMAYEYERKSNGLSVSDVTTPAFEQYLARFERCVTGLNHSTGNLMREMIAKGPAGYDALMVYESVAIDMLNNAQGRWGPVRVIYPKYNLWNDNPYCVLHTPWTTPAQEEAAEAFLQFLLSEPMQLRALAHGFRPGNPDVSARGADSPFVRYARNGLNYSLPAMCQFPSPEVIDGLLQTWSRHAVPR